MQQVAESGIWNIPMTGNTNFVRLLHQSSISLPSAASLAGKGTWIGRWLTRHRSKHMCHFDSRFSAAHLSSSTSSHPSQNCRLLDALFHHNTWGATCVLESLFLWNWLMMLSCIVFLDTPESLEDGAKGIEDQHVGFEAACADSNESLSLEICSQQIVPHQNRICTKKECFRRSCLCTTCASDLKVQGCSKQPEVLSNFWGLTEKVLLKSCTSSCSRYLQQNYVRLQ